MALRGTTEPTDQPTSVAQRLREVTAREAASRGQRFDLVAQLRNEHGWSWQQIGAELGITKQGALKVYAKHVQESLRRNTATDRQLYVPSASGAIRTATQMIAAGGSHTDAA